MSYYDDPDYGYGFDRYDFMEGAFYDEPDDYNSASYGDDGPDDFDHDFDDDEEVLPLGAYRLDLLERYCLIGDYELKTKSYWGCGRRRWRSKGFTLRSWRNPMSKGGSTSRKALARKMDLRRQTIIVDYGYVV